MKYIFLWLVISLYASAGYASNSSIETTEEIQHIVNVFIDSINKKNKKEFLDIFYSNSIPWIGVNSKETLELAKSRNYEIPVITEGNPINFIQNIVSSKNKIKEEIWDLNITTDGFIASVHFKYSFHINGYKQNWGDEAWQLVKVKDEWKINSVIYSITYNPSPNK